MWISASKLNNNFGIFALFSYFCKIKCNRHSGIMGTFINIGNAGFRRIRNSEYVDKSGLIAVVNSTLFTERCFSCVTRCRRFGKSMAAKMLCAYYDHSVDSRNLFTDLEIAKDPSFDEHLNKYPVISLDMTYFVTRFHDDDIVGKIDAALREDVMDAYPQVETRESDDLMDCLVRIAATTVYLHHRRMGCHLPRVQARNDSYGPLCKLAAAYVQEPECCQCLRRSIYDGHTSCEEV